MQYIIYDEKQVLNEREAQSLEEVIKKKISKFDRFFKNYDKPVHLEVHISRPSPQLYYMGFIVNMKSKFVHVHDKGEDVANLARDLFHKLERAVRKQKETERKEHLYKRKQRQVSSIGENIKALEEHYQQENREAFRNLFNTITPNLKNYIQRRLLQATISRTITPEDVNINELLDELYLKLYNEFPEIPKDENKITGWIYKKADKLLEEKLEESESKSEQEPVLESLSDEEFEKIQSSYSADAEKEISISEEFDLSGNNYFEDIYPVKAEEETLTPEYESPLAFNREAQTALARLPVFKRSVYDLFVVEHLSVEEIAETKDTTQKEIENTIEEVRSFLRENLLEKENTQV